MESMQVDNISIDDLHMGYEDVPEHEVVVGNVPIELKYYISNYKGNICYQRLFFIAKHAPNLKNEALRLAHDFVKEKTMNIDIYNQIFEMFAKEKFQKFRVSEVEVKQQDEPMPLGEDANISDTIWQDVCSGNNPLNIVYDQAWVDNTRRKNTIQIEQLDTDLKNFKANAIKESIRRASDELGDVFLLNGQLHSAYRCYTRSRDYCTSPYQELIMCLNVVKVAIYQNSWTCVNAHVNKAEYLPEIRDSSGAVNDVVQSINSNLIGLSAQTPQLDSRQTPSTGLSFKDAIAQTKTLLAVAGGLCELYFRRYRSSVTYFLQVNSDHLEHPALYATSTDIAFYLTLCALATMERTELSTQILGPSNVNARMLLEAEPTCREIIYSFHTADYSSCLTALSKVENQLKMDIFISSHVSGLMKDIRAKALCQYFSPYHSANLGRMAEAFGTKRPALELELAELIQNGAMQARIDSHNGLLKALTVDQRSICFSQALKAADEYCRRTQTLLLRLALARQRLAVQSEKFTNAMDQFDRRLIPDEVMDFDPRYTSYFLNNQERGNLMLP